MVDKHIYAFEKMDDIMISTRTGQHIIQFEKSFKILGYTFNQAGRTHDSLEERMQSANKVWWRIVKIHRSKVVPWRVKCRRMCDQVHSVCSAVAARIGPGAKPSWTELKAGKHKL